MPRPGLPIACAMLALLLAAPAAHAGGGEARPLDAAAPTAVTAFSPNRVIVEWAPGASRSDRVAARQSTDVTSLRPLGDRAVPAARG